MLNPKTLIRMIRASKHVLPFVKAVDKFIDKQDEDSFYAMLTARDVLGAAYATRH